MKRTATLLLLVPFLLGQSGSPDDEFWTWFGQNEAALFALDPDNRAPSQEVFAQLAEQLRRVDPDLTFELGPVVDGRRELVLSADGVKAAFPAVQSLAARAPALERWKITAFRPRRPALNPLKVAGVVVQPDDFHVRLTRSGEKIDLIVFIRGYTESRKAAHGQAAFLLLDRALGEYDVETKVRYVDLEPLGSEPPKDSVPLRELAGAFDALLSAKQEKRE